MYTCCVYSSVMRKGENTLLDVKHHHILFPVKRLGQGVQASRLQYPIDQHSWRRAGRKTQRTLITSRASGRGWRASRSASTASPCGSLRSASSCTAASHRAAHLAVPRPRDGAMRRRSRSSRAGCSSACTCYTRASGRCHRAGRAKRRSRAAQSAPLQVVGGAHTGNGYQPRSLGFDFSRRTIRAPCASRQSPPRRRGRRARRCAGKRAAAGRRRPPSRQPG